MDDFQSTRPSLLVRIRDLGDEEAWRQFVALYVPPVYAFLRGRGLQDADAADLTQDVLRSVASAAGRFSYDPQRGTFRSYLFTVARNRLKTFLEARGRGMLGRGGTSAQVALERHPARDEGDEAALWERAYRQSRFAWAAERVREGVQEPTWQAFWRTAVEGRSVKETAEALGLSVGAVYVARSRVLARLREQIRQLPPD